jgi:hypothetical protein
LQDNNFLTIDSPVIASACSKTFGELASPGHAASHAIGVTTPPTKVKIGAVSITVFFSTQVGATEGIEAEVQARLKSAKKIRVIAMLISDPGILASLLALKNKDIEGVLDPHEMKVVKVVIAGSYNFSENAEANDENLLVIEWTACCEGLRQLFHRAVC